MAKGDQEEQSILEATTSAGKSSPLKDLLKYLMDLLSVFSFPYLSPAVLREFRTFLYGHLRL
jgi:hypothetical protein